MNRPFERLFFALWPDDSLREQIVETRKLVPDLDRGRLMAAGNLHLTLHFLGNISLDRVECFIHQARRVSAQPFSLELDTPGYFKKARVVWLGCQQLPPSLDDLHRQLGKHIETCEFKVERRPYNPHMTLARKINKRPDMPPLVEPLQWHVERFVLVQSVSIEGGVRYQVKESFPLQ